MIIGKKDDKDKPELLNLFKSLWQPIVEVSRVHNFGGKKYGMDNWKNVEEDRYKNAAIRHLAEVLNDNDENIEQDEFYCYHAAQLAWNALVLCYFAIKRKELRK
jgi:hypothetical protein